MIVYIENPINSIKILFDLISEFNKITGYKVNIQESMALLYTSNEQPERETKKEIPFTIAKTTKKIPRNKFNHRGKRPVLGKL